MSNYLSVAETAKLIRASLRESFPGVKFSVRSSSYAGGASIRVGWVDGPTTAAVEAVAHPWQGSYFDGMQDYKGSRYHTLDGEPVRFGADFVFCEREETHAVLARAARLVAKKYMGLDLSDDAALQLSHLFREGELWEVMPNVDAWSDHWNLQSLIRRMAAKITDTPFPQPSKTLQRLTQCGDDGYHSGQYLSQSEAMRQQIHAI